MVKSLYHPTGRADNGAATSAASKSTTSVDNGLMEDGGSPDLSSDLCLANRPECQAGKPDILYVRLSSLTGAPTRRSN